MKDSFIKAYFEETKQLNQREVLYEILAEFGWSDDKVNEILDDESIASRVQSEITHYQQRGVRGVPFFVFNDQYGISGAQPTEVFLEALASLDSTENIAEGDSCDPMKGKC